MFLDLPDKSIGHIGGGKMDRTGCVDVAVIQSLYRKDAVKDFVAEYGQVIVDECHHISAFTFEQVMRQVKAKYVVGLTATPTRFASQWCGRRWNSASGITAERTWSRRGLPELCGPARGRRDSRAAKHV